MENLTPPQGYGPLRTWGDLGAVTFVLEKKIHNAQMLELLLQLFFVVSSWCVVLNWLNRRWSACQAHRSL